MCPLRRVKGRHRVLVLAQELRRHEPLETREVRRAPAPEDPSPTEVESHKLTGHAVFQSWCRHSVRGRGPEAAHTCTEKPDSMIPVLSWDYCYLKAAPEEEASDNLETASTGVSRGAPERESLVLVMWDSKGK